MTDLVKLSFLYERDSRARVSNKSSWLQFEEFETLEITLPEGSIDHISSESDFHRSIKDGLDALCEEKISGKAATVYSADKLSFSSAEDLYAFLQLLVDYVRKDVELEVSAIRRSIDESSVRNYVNFDAYSYRHVFLALNQLRKEYPLSEIRSLVLDTDEFISEVNSQENVEDEFLEAYVIALYASKKQKSQKVKKLFRV